HRIPQIAGAMDIDPEGKRTEELEKAVFIKLLTLLDELNMPKRLMDLSVPKDDVERIARKLLTFTRLIQRNPRIISEDDARNLVMEMWSGPDNIP
ncbi:MAG: iron-containing alcohol dehydrogenase, partial [Candidatus Bathyarchaeia archaeon]